MQCYVGGMTPKRNDLKALRQMISEAHDILRTTILPEARSQRAYKLLTAALNLADNLLEESPAAVLGAKGGKQTAKRGPEYFAKIASIAEGAKRRTPQKTDHPIIHDGIRVRLDNRLTKNICTIINILQAFNLKY